MNKTLVLLLLLHVSLVITNAQTQYGTGAGTAGTHRSYFGFYAGNASTASSSYNSFLGAYSGRNTNTGNSNTGIGSDALKGYTEGYQNTAIGAGALEYNTTSDDNVAIGRQACNKCNSAGPNTALGYRALYAFVNYNTASPASANTAVGAMALYNVQGDGSNVAAGFHALYSSTRPRNTATGAYAMDISTTQSENTSYGFKSLYSPPYTRNAAFGYQALYSIIVNCETGGRNTAFGAYAGFAEGLACLTNTTSLGYNTKVTASNQVRIGNSSVTSIGGQVSWSNLSDGRFKKDIRNDVPGLDFINQLNPVSYTLDKEAVNKFLGTTDIPNESQSADRKSEQCQTGFIAQEVELIVKKGRHTFSAVQSPQNEHDPYTIRYSEFVVPLVKAVQELSDIAELRNREIAGLKQSLRNYSSDSSDGSGSLTEPTDESVIQIEISNSISQANLIIYDTDGREIENLSVSERGITSVNLRAINLSPGQYLYALIADGEVMSSHQVEVK